MNINQQAGWLRGFLDSLLLGENVTKGQIQILKTKIEELIDNLDEYGGENDDEDYTPPTYSSNKNQTSYDIIEPMDDLPF
jgi:hypothetical protein